MKKLLLALGILGLAVQARGGTNYDLRQTASSATMNLNGAINVGGGSGARVTNTGQFRGPSYLDTTGNSGLAVEQLQTDIYASGISQVSLTTTTANWTSPVKFSSYTAFSGSPYYTVEKYGLRPTNTAAQNDTGLALMAAQIPTGATIRWDQGTYYITSFSWPNKRWVWIGHSGVGTAGTVISGTGDPVLDFPVAGTNFSKRSILQNLTLVNSSTGRALRVENTGIRLQDVQINGGNTAVEITAMDSQSWDQVQIVAISTAIYISTNSAGYAINNNLFKSVNVSCTNSSYGTGLLLNRNAPSGTLVHNLFDAFDVTNCGTGVNIDGAGANGNFFNSPWFENVDVKDLMFSTYTHNSYFSPRWTTTTTGTELSISGSGIGIGTTTVVNSSLDISFTAPSPSVATGPTWAQTGMTLRDKAGNSNSASCLGLGYQQAGATYPPGAYCYRQTNNGGFTNGSLELYGRSTTNDVAGQLFAAFESNNATFPSSATVTGSFTALSSVTVRGTAFSVNTSTFVVTGGKVGVGTASPDQAFHVSGAADTYVVIEGRGANTQDRGIEFQNSAGAAAGYIIMTPNTVGTDAMLRFYVGGGGGGDVKMFIHDDGKIGIGTTSPASLLDVAGGIGHYSRTLAQLVAISPGKAGESYYCSDCSPPKIVVATGTSAGNFADAVGATFK